jgi:hypothetical protein
MQLGALPDGRANAPKTSNTLLAHHYCLRICPVREWIFMVKPTGLNPYPVLALFR